MSGPTEEQQKEVLAVAAGLNHALAESGVDIQIAASASMLLAAEYAAQSDNRTKDIVESFRLTLVDARKRLRAAN